MFRLKIHLKRDQNDGDYADLLKINAKETGR